MLDSTEYTRVTSMELDEVEDAQDEEHDEDDLRQTQTIKERRNSEIFHPHSVIAMRRRHRQEIIPVELLLNFKSLVNHSSDNAGFVITIIQRRFHSEMECPPFKFRLRFAYSLRLASPCEYFATGQAVQAVRSLVPPTRSSPYFPAGQGRQPTSKYGEVSGVSLGT